MINLAEAMDRGAVQIYIWDALTNLPIAGAKISVYNAATNALVGSGVVPSTPTIDPRTSYVSQYPAYVDVINLPFITPSTKFIARVSAAKYTASPQNAFFGSDVTHVSKDGSFVIVPGYYINGIQGYMPPKSANFTVIGEAPDGMNPPHLAAWVPYPQAAKFIVSPRFYLPDPASAVLPYLSISSTLLASFLP